MMTSLWYVTVGAPGVPGLPARAQPVALGWWRLTKVLLLLCCVGQANQALTYALANCHASAARNRRFVSHVLISRPGSGHCAVGLCALWSSVRSRLCVSPCVDCCGSYRQYVLCAVCRLILEYLVVIRLNLGSLPRVDLLREHKLDHVRRRLVSHACAVGLGQPGHFFELPLAFPCSPTHSSWFAHCSRCCVVCGTTTHTHLPPFPRLLACQPLQYIGIVASLRSGNIQLFREQMAVHRRRFMVSGVYLLLERVQPLVLRRLFKRMCVEARYCVVGGGGGGCLASSD
jgi:hypothetical protein